MTQLRRLKESTMAHPNPSPLVFVFTREGSAYGSGISYYTTPLVVLPSPDHDERTVAELINNSVAADSYGHHRPTAGWSIKETAASITRDLLPNYYPDHRPVAGRGIDDPELLVTLLAQRGITAYWIDPAARDD